MIGIEGLLKLVKVFQKLQASLNPISEDDPLCHPELSPPAHNRPRASVMAPTSASQPEALTLATQPNPRESVEVPSPRGAEP